MTEVERGKKSEFGESELGREGGQVRLRFYLEGQRFGRIENKIGVLYFRILDYFLLN